MEKKVLQTYLYDFYGELLTDHQKNIYEDFVLNDLSLGEIAEQQGISRQGVHDLVKRCDRILTGYEEKLRLLERFRRIKKKVEEIHRLTEETERVIAECGSKADCGTAECESTVECGSGLDCSTARRMDVLCSSLRRLSDEILEEL